MKKEERELLIKNKGKLEEQRRFDLKSANTSVNELSKYLIIASSILIGLSSTILSNESIRTGMTCTEKFLFAGSWLFLVVSIFLGISQFFINYKYFIEQATVRLGIITDISNGKYNNYTEFFDDSVKRQKDLKEQSSMNVTKAQVGLVAAGLLSLAAFVYFSLFA
ncbi:hypothetical protein ES702_05460 [subsurface metagenome]